MAAAIDWAQFKLRLAAVWSSAWRGEKPNVVTDMKFIKTLTVMACAAAFLLSTSGAMAGESCCVKAKAKGKDCSHPCCVEAHKAGKTCEKCQADASCCDKAIAKGKDCSHPCCVAAVKAGKVCEKCNKKEAKKEEKKDEKK